MPGRFITFEGVEGSGKTTQIRLAGEFLREKGLPVTTTQEPGGTPLGERIRDILLNRKGFEISAEAELFLFSAARVQHAASIILPALESGRVILCDRFTDATLAYQAYGRGLPADVVGEVCRIASQGLHPGMTLLFDLPVETGLARAMSRMSALEESRREDRFEREALEFHQRIRDGYLDIARREPGRVKIIDASKPAGEVWNDVRSRLSAYLGI